ncbi:MAG: T9SS C-terminal target domain-containing protein, partial [Cytophagales bacterium]
YNLHGKAITPLFPDERTLDLSSFPKGMYFVYSSLDGVIYTQKLLIE